MEGILLVNLCLFKGGCEDRDYGCLLACLPIYQLSVLYGQHGRKNQFSKDHSCLELEGALPPMGSGPLVSQRRTRRPECRGLILRGFTLFPSGSADKRNTLDGPAPLCLAVSLPPAETSSVKRNSETEGSLSPARSLSSAPRAEE